MKKCIILLLALIFWQTVWAGVVTVEEARLRAATFFAEVSGRPGDKKSGQEDFKWVYSYPEVKSGSSSDAPALYVFARESGGYAVVSGDDAALPVLGYSLDGQFPVANMPENLQSLLAWYADIIAHARSQHWSAGSEKATGVRAGPGNSAVQLYTARWGQGDPFNRLVAEINGEKPPIGCTATAIAIVMRYYKYPLRGDGKLPDYSYVKEGVQYTVSGFSLGHEYDWNLMPEEYTASYTEEASEQIARLLYDVAVMCRMNFYPGGSSASLINGAARLVTFFGYDERLATVRRSEGYKDAEWERLVRDEIDAGRPVLYAGTNSEGGSHAFVIDGYSGQDYFGINFGWMHKSSAFYTISPISGRESQLIKYYKSQYMVTGVMPKEEGGPSLYAERINQIPKDFAVGKEFTMQNNVRNRSPFAASLDLCYVLYDCNGAFLAEVCPVQHVDFPAGGSYLMSTSSCKILSQPKEGDMIVLSYRDIGSGNWVPVDQYRLSKIVFTTKPLREKVSLCFIPGRERGIYWRLNKDLAWEILREDGSPLFDEIVYNEITAGPDCSYIYTMSDTYDSQCDVALCRIGFSPGTYFLRVVNPATGEEMVVKLRM